MKVTMHEAKTHFSKWVRKANEGEQIIVTNRGEPVAEITALKSKTEADKPQRRPGRLKGILPDFTWEEWKAMDREIEEDFERSANEPLDPGER